MARGEPEEVGGFVGGQHRPAGSRHSRHLSEGRRGVAEVVDAADGVNHVERGVLEWQGFALGPDESARRLGVLSQTPEELVPGHVDAVNFPTWRQEGQVLAVADPDFEDPGGPPRGQVPEHLPPGGRLARPLADEKDTFPEPELSPLLAVIKIGGNLVRPRQRADRLQDAVHPRVFSRALAADRRAFQCQSAVNAAGERRGAPSGFGHGVQGCQGHEGLRTRKSGHAGRHGP